VIGQLDIQLTIVFVHGLFAFALVFTSGWAAPVAVFILAFSPNCEFALLFTSDLAAHR
jgi:hypothetical protein